MFKMKETNAFEGACPPGAPNENTPCAEDGHYCEDCIEMFNRLPIERRAVAFLRRWWKNQRKVTYYHATDEMAQSWGFSIAKDSMVREQDEAFYDGWAVFIELGRRMIVIGRRVEI